MSSHQPFPAPQDPHRHAPVSPVEAVEEAASEAGLVTGVALRAGEIALAVFAGLLVCPPLMILAVVVVVPLVAVAVAVSLIGVILAVPYLLVRRARGHHSGHAALLLERLHHARHALHALLPHRILADARRLHRP
jgi:hypothetical protein